MTGKKPDLRSPDSLDFLRPGIHFTPVAGFMNDPNGLVFDGTQYHLYYQHNPKAAYSAEICWGHATSHDLLSWKDQPIALHNTPEGQAFSGCALLDTENTSGLFDGFDGPNIVALYTRSLPTRQSQYLAVSHDDGQSFTSYESNPVLDIGSPDFRDPQVLWHEPSAQWVMVIAEVDRHRIGFYGSTNLIDWTVLSHFGPAGLPTVNYECPNLIEIRDEGGKRRWVLFVSINPGSPMGGSVTQYFIGNFDGRAFTPCDGILRLTDFAKDAYALQVWSNMPDDEAVSIAWMGNWQYCQELPTPDWRGVMTLPRTMSIRQDTHGYPRLVQVPRGLEPFRQSLLSESAFSLNEASRREIGLPESGAIELVIRLTAAMPRPVEHGPVGPTINRFELAFANAGGERLSVGYDVPSSQIWLDRSKLRGFDHAFFTGRFSAPVDTTLYPDRRTLDLHLILDGCAFELYANQYLETATALVYPEQPFDRLYLSAEGTDFLIEALEINTLDKTMERATL
ncbi:glycoside hydrolase family 32 protein [Asaia krungthepensis]|uniref:Levanase n=1 Tax=Asaia krungthepensis NRIC 0535 TaxID=1307925 RepID=A0ABQ0PYU0_9PROT|nr:glycoside hydrolase family 32 protein [Asaia krungthepensis]GBQ84954.1 levanase [Asaia krungthepensis NRIC 0535]